MHKTLTYISAILASLVGVFVVSFYICGLAVEYKFNQIVNNIALLSNQKVEVTSYQRHWFTSDAVVTITIDPQYLFSWQGKQIEVLVGAMTQKSFLRKIVIEAHVKHGPLFYTEDGFRLAQAFIDAEVVLTAEQNALLQRTATMPSLLTAHALINLFGDGALFINSSKFAYHGPNINTLWNGFAWRLTFSHALDEFHSYFDFFGYELDTNFLNVKLNNFKFNSNLRKIAGQLLPDYKLFLLPYLQCQIKTGVNVNTFLINDLRYESFLHSSDNDTLRSDASLQIANIDSNGLNYRNIDFDWHADKLDAKIFADLINAVMQLRQTEKITGLNVAYFLEILVRLLNNDAVLDINKLEMITPWGKLNVTANAVFKKRPNYSGLLVSLLANSQAILNVKLEQGLALYLLQQYYKNESATDSFTPWPVRAQKTLDALLRDNKLLIDNGSYSFSLNYANRKLLWNGQPFSWLY